MRSIGQTLSHFKIVAKLGEGGMGEVYRAEDLDLKREVALKILPPDVAGSQERLARFQREAEAVAALDHPNIVTIYTVEEAEGVHFFTMQLVQGETLSHRIPPNGMPLEDFFAVAIPLADAISTAHEKGIVHRDLKPANIMFSYDGRVKILDFGLAKLTESPIGGVVSSELPTQSPADDGLTGEEQVLGTAAYMSPEQAQGGRIDQRSDIFSLSIVLYQMATGSHPFKGDTNMSRISSILKDTPSSVTDLKPELPRHLGRIIRHGLEKDIKRRYQAALDLRNDLEELKDEIDAGEILPSGTATAGAPLRRPARRLSSGLPYAIGAGLALVIGLLGWLYLSRPEVPKASPIRSVPLTSWAGSELDPALSPQGDRLAFVWDGETNGRFDLYVVLLGASEPLRLTHGPGEHRYPSWSPDGLEIAYLRGTDPAQYDVAIIPGLGGAPRVIGAVRGLAFPGLDWSPDGRWLATVDRMASDESESIFLLSTETGKKQRLSTPPSGGIGDRHPVFSPDGQTVAFVRWYEAPRNEVHLVAVEGGELRRLTAHEGWIRGLDWMPDGASLVFSSLWKGTAGLWRLSLAGELSQLSVGEHAWSVAVAASGDRMVISQKIPDTNLWRIGGPVVLEPTSAQRLIGSTRDEWGAQFSPDGTRIVFSSDRSGAGEIWICGSQGENPVQLTADDRIDSAHAKWSPDGKHLALGRVTDGNLDVWVLAADGAFPRRLTDSASVDAASGWTRDGRSIYFFSDRTGSYEVWRVPMAGGEPEQITSGGGILPKESDDGRFVYYLRQTQPFSIWRTPVAGGEESLVLQKEGLSVSGFDVWRESLVYLLTDGRTAPRFERLDPETGRVETIAELEPGTRIGRYGRISVSPDGRWILYPQDDSPGSDLILIEGVADAQPSTAPPGL